MDLRRLGHFSVLADELSFRVASSRLHLTQPALTRSIASLERDLGVRLFDRDKRHVALTPEGAALLDRARALLRDADALARVASDLRPERRRELRIGCYGTALAELTYPVLRTFSDRHPDVSLTVSDVTFDRGIEPLLTGELDIALLRAPCDVPSLTTVPLFTEPASVQLCAEHRLASERSVDVCDLLDDPWNALPLTTPDKWNRYFTCVEQRGGEAPLIGGRGRTIAEAASLVAFKQIVALVPGSTARQRHSGVRAVSVRGVEPFRVGVAYPRSKPAALTEAFVAVATDVTRRRLSLVPGSETLI
jgi:DNA-binding transcriptional LysR family regulator